MTQLLTSADTNSGEEEPLTDGEHRAICELYMRYNLAYDTGDEVAWAETFTSDGVFRSANAVQGRQKLREYVRGRRRDAADLTYHETQHWNANLRLVKKDGWVQGVCYIVQIGRDKQDERPVLVTQGCYVDKVVSDNGGWHFAERRVYRSMADVRAAIA